MIFGDNRTAECDALKYSMEIEYRADEELCDTRGMTGGIGFAYTITLINTTEAVPALINADAHMIMLNLRYVTLMVILMRFVSIHFGGMKEKRLKYRGNKLARD